MKKWRLFLVTFVLATLLALGWTYGITSAEGSAPTSALSTVPPQNVVVAGPSTAASGEPTVFTASVVPISTTVPLTYVWTATEHSPVTHVLTACVDAVSFTWTMSGVKAVDVVVSNAADAVSAVHQIFIDPVAQVYLPLVMRTYPPGPRILYFRADKDLPYPGDTVELSWASTDAVSATLYHLLPTGQFGTFWAVEPTGSKVYEIPSETRNYELFALFVRDEQGRSTSATLSVELACPDEWFFDPAPDECPSGPAEIGPGAEQLFEQGIMLWVESQDYIYVLYADGGVGAWDAFPDAWEPGDPISDTNIIPPEGYYQPVRGFGLVWREALNVRDRLGWAIEPEEDYETAYQRTARWKYNEFFIQATDGGVWHLHPEGSDWSFIPPSSGTLCLLCTRAR